MKKGQWLKNLLLLFFGRQIPLRDVGTLIIARILPKPISFSFQGIEFKNVDHILWSVIADIFVNQVYRFKDININPKSIVIDIGAHRGAFTAYAALHSTTVISYEPHPENYKHILELIEINSLKNVIVHNVAIGARAGKGYLFNSPMSSRHHLVDNSSIDERDNSLEINILSLDECLQPFELIDFLKMDCEGAEVDILLNASDKTISKVRCIAAEIHDPITSSKIQELYLRLTCIFKDISLVDQNKDNLGYLYAVQ